MSEVATDSEESVRELADTGQALEADAVDGEENVPPADETSKSEVHVHGEEPKDGEK